jgi:hypothetical protein
VLCFRLIGLRFNDAPDNRVHVHQSGTRRLAALLDRLERMEEIPFSRDRAIRGNTPRTSAEAEEFYLHLSRQHSDLLAFRVPGYQNKRQLVIAWILSGRG